MQSLLIQLGVKEVLLPEEGKTSDYDLSKIRMLIDRCNIVVTDRKKSASFLGQVARRVCSLPSSGDFNAGDVEQDLNRLLRGNLQAASRRASTLHPLCRRNSANP